MDETVHSPMTPLDEIVSDDRLQMIKAMLPYLPPAQARFLAVAAKWQELQNTLQLYPQTQPDIQAMNADFSTQALNDSAILKDLKLYGGTYGKQLADNISQILDMLQLISLMQTAQAEEKEEKK